MDLGLLRETLKRFTRAPGWSKLRQEHLRRNGSCVVCGRRGHWGLQVHHIKSFKDYPELELRSDNLATLCRRCHLLVGHLGDWQCCNGEFAGVVGNLGRLIEERRR